MKKTVCIFIHYDSEDRYSDEDVEYIKKISSIFSSVIVLTSNTKPISNLSNIQTIFGMSNVGYDFGKLEAYIDSINLQDIEELYLFNNSCLLVRDPFVSIEYMKNKNLDFWGYTTSTEETMHIQSYFLYFKNNALSLLKTFLSNNSPTKNNFSHSDVVRKIELQLLRYMYENKMKCGAYIQAHKLFPQTNSTIIHADKLLVLNPHYPFIKKKVYIFAKTFDKNYLLSLI
jgi:lipopolysaccharide biosynthesis protein